MSAPDHLRGVEDLGAEGASEPKPEAEVISRTV